MYSALLSTLVGCSTVDRNWPSDFRIGLKPNEAYVNHKMIPQYFDSINEQGETFYLYYFTKGPYKKSAEPVKTILFCAGGPGAVFWPTGENLFLYELERDYRVVYFHLRGAGFSQFPQSNKYDRYLRTSYAIGDIDKIFQDLAKEDSNFKHWDAVVGFSYGTVLAQQYTALNPTHVAKLVLASPISRHPFKKPIADPERQHFLADIASAPALLLKNIFTANTSRVSKDGTQIETNAFKQQFPNFFDLIKLQRQDYTDDKIITEITDEVTDIFNAQDAALLSASPLIDFYEELKTHVHSALQANAVHLPALQKVVRYDRQFFVDLRNLRDEGWAETLQSDKRQEIVARALRIAAQIFLVKTAIDVKHGFKTKFNIDTDDLCKSMGDDSWRRNNRTFVAEAKTHGIWCEEVHCICNHNDSRQNRLVGSSRRVFYNMAVYDGLDPGFLDNWSQQSRLEVIDILKARKGWWFDPFIRTIGFVEDEVPDTWDPSEPRHRHSVPTLILRGKADPVTAGKQANHIFEKALLGPRYLIEFDGVGHRLDLGAATEGSWPESLQTQACGTPGITVTTNIQTKACILDSFVKGKNEAVEEVLVRYRNSYVRSLERNAWISALPITCAVIKNSPQATLGTRDSSADSLCRPHIDRLTSVKKEIR
jgi:pimeloyl-ACP methyl ester carboxylesterase